jgi:hypothetical protein
MFLPKKNIKEIIQFVVSKEANKKNQEKLKVYLIKNGINLKPDSKKDRGLRKPTRTN